MEKLKSKAQARYSFAAYLGQQGKRCTPERLHVLDIALEQRKPFTAEELHRCCLAATESLSVSRATVFNTLPLLVSAGYVMRILGPGMENNYETIRSTAAAKSRIFLVCSVCGKVMRRTSPALAEWVSSQSFKGFHPNSASAITYVYGECSSCRKSQGKHKTYTN